MNDYKSRVAMYLRKSRRDDPDETIDETLERHRGILTEYAQRQDLNIKKVYKEVVSGDGLFTRPQMVALLSDIERGAYTAVLCVDIDRLGRSSTKDSGIILETFKDNECAIITPDKVYDLSDEVDELTVEMKSFFARQELKSIRKRLVRGEIETIKAGGHTGEPPFGYKRKWIDKMPTLEIVPDEAETVRMIFDMYTIDHLGSSSIAKKLAELGITAPDGGQFARTTVRMILTNPIYTGRIVWNRKKRVKKRKPTDKAKEIANPPEEWIDVKGLHEPIITEEQWNEAERIRKTRAHPPTFSGTIKNPYSGLIVCDNCGSLIQRFYTKRDGARLLCPITGCNCSVDMNIFTIRFRELIAEELGNLKMNKKPERGEIDPSIKRKAAATEKQLSTITAQRNRLHDLLEQGVYDTETFLTRQKTLAEKQTALETEIENLNKQIDLDKNKLSIEEAIPAIENLLHDWDNMSAIALNQALKRVIQKVTYRRDSRRFTKTDFIVNISWNF